MAGTIRFDDATSGSDSFDIGSAIINKLSCSLNNYDSKFDQYDFDGAVLQVYVGVIISETTKEWIRKGTYTIDDPVSKGSTIAVTALDNMHKFDRLYSDSTLSYPATLGEIVRDACSRCAVSLASSRFDNDSYTVPVRPDDESMTYREMISYAAQIAGCFARINVDGALELRWYDFDAFEGEDHLDGGRFDNYTSAQYQTGDNAAGGEFDNLDPNVYVTGDNYDGGTFDALARYHHIYKLFSQSIGTDDVIITGIKVTEDTEEGAAYLVGEEGYILSIKDNPLIQAGQSQAVAQYLYAKIGGNQFRPLTVSCLSDPTIEAGDVGYVSDRKGNSYKTVLTNVAYTIGSQQTITCDAETPSAKRSSRSTAETKTLIKARQEAQKQISNYDLAVQQLTSLMTQSFGVYKSEEIMEDGSTVYYMHNKPVLSESKTIWKMTADAFAVSTDGGKTWSAGIDSSGNAVVNVLSAVGINFDWARGGTLSLGGANNGNGVMKVYNSTGREGTVIDASGVKSMHTDGSYTMMGPVGMQHHDSSGDTDYHYLMHSGTYTFSGTFNGKWSSDIQLPGAFKGKNFKVTVQFAGMVPREEYNDVLSSLALDTSTNQENGTFKIMCRCNSFSLEQRTGPDGSLLNQLTDPASVTISYLVIA
ncbi:hypothetical protein [Diplocloster modestus]|uniref:Uncharacterized protein n=1 Tax=Diplocloster modestus TaxID=2850322 RepID=A0ABS6K0S4_9FIRM|nr:hypothetical protein [Diplocloster modestus]MBU9724445.1 hypothetical protein [Diplocloster modestus]